MVSRASVYVQCMAGRRPEFERLLEDTVRGCSWMTGSYVLQMRRVWASHFGVMIDGVVGFEQMVVDVVDLWQRAEEVGDERWCSVFGQWYDGVREVLRGGLYRCPDFCEVAREGRWFGVDW